MSDKEDYLECLVSEDASERSDVQALLSRILAFLYALGQQLHAVALPQAMFQSIIVLCRKKNITKLLALSIKCHAALS